MQLNDHLDEIAILLNDIDNMHDIDCTGCGAKQTPLVTMNKCPDCNDARCKDCVAVDMTSPNYKPKCRKCSSPFVSLAFIGSVTMNPDLEISYMRANELFQHTLSCTKTVCTPNCAKMSVILDHSAKVNKTVCETGGPKYCRDCSSFKCVAIIHARRCFDARCTIPFCDFYKLRLGLSSKEKTFVENASSFAKWKRDEAIKQFDDL
jgi:hypothetical protein